MLDRMRRHKGWLKWSLALVVLAFVFLYVPGFVDQTVGTDLPTGVLAEVGDHEITVAEFRRVYLRQLQTYRLQSGGEITEEVLRKLGIDRQILQRMIDEYAGVAEAERLGLEVSNAEIRARIVSLPGLQENEQFIGQQRYRQLLQAQNPPMSPAQFEEDIRKSILLDRLRATVTNWLTVSDAETADEHQRRNERVKINVVAFRADDYREEVEVNDDDIALLYSQESASYQVPEKRQLQFLLIDESVIADSITPAEEEIDQYYNANLSQYSTPGQIRASHILLRTEEQDEAEVEALAAELVTQARGGADFAELARRHSEDEVTAPEGGSVGLFGRGSMVREFEDAAFALEPGAISDPVKSAIGYHIIKVTEKQEETTQPIDTVRETIKNVLKQERARARANNIAQAIAADINTPADLEQAATKRGYELQESGFAAPGEPILGLGLATEVSQRAFQLEQGGVDGPIRTASGPAFVTVTATQDSYIPPLEDVRAQVREDVIRKKSLARAQQKAAEIVESLKAADDFSAAAEAAGLQVGTSELITRGTALPEVGVSAAVEAAAFTLSVGEVSEAIETDNAAAIVHVVERAEASAEALAKVSDTLRDELLLIRQGQFFSAYMTKAKERLRIIVDLATLEQALTAV